MGLINSSCETNRFTSVNVSLKEKPSDASHCALHKSQPPERSYKALNVQGPAVLTDPRPAHCAPVPLSCRASGAPCSFHPLFHTLPAVPEMLSPLFAYISFILLILKCVSWQTLLWISQSKLVPRFHHILRFLTFY